MFDRHEHHPSAAGLHRVAPDDLIRGPVSPLDEDIRLHEPNDLRWRVLVENHDGINAFERGKQFRAFTFRRDRAAWSFVPADGRVAVQSDDQQISKASGALEIPDVAGMKKVEDAVGKNDAAAGGAL